MNGAHLRYVIWYDQLAEEIAWEALFKLYKDGKYDSAGKALATQAWGLEFISLAPSKGLGSVVTDL